MPAILVALHVYDPALALKSGEKIRLLPLGNTRPPRDHWTKGGGSPLTEQVSVNTVFSIPLISTGVGEKLGGTRVKEATIKKGSSI